MRERKGGERGGVAKKTDEKGKGGEGKEEREGGEGGGGGDRQTDRDRQAGR